MEYGVLQEEEIAGILISLCLADIDHHLNIIIAQVGTDKDVPCDVFDGKVVYGEKKAQLAVSPSWPNFIFIEGAHRTGVRSSENLLKSILRQASSLNFWFKLYL
ncbi:unnamed protein product [Allacma fusca]|uniref:Uncharacterized protein n=1 Tax=Allacma fusca TaxID=39272 RepID=A0A8J2P5Q1_9HEXA|nr:unnamed protein product [Allacma fusca]